MRTDSRRGGQADQLTHLANALRISYRRATEFHDHLRSHKQTRERVRLSVLEREAHSREVGGSRYSGGAAQGGASHALTFCTFFDAAFASLADCVGSAVEAAGNCIEQAGERHGLSTACRALACRPDADGAVESASTATAAARRDTIIFNRGGTR